MGKESLILNHLHHSPRAEKDPWCTWFYRISHVIFKMMPAKSGALFRHENPNLIYWHFFLQKRDCPICQELNCFLWNSFSFVCFPAVSSSELASDENCCCFALLQFSLKDECSLPSVESSMIKRKDFVPYVLVERLSKECCNHRLFFFFFF